MKGAADGPFLLNDGMGARYKPNSAVTRRCLQWVKTGGPANVASGWKRTLATPVTDRGVKSSASASSEETGGCCSWSKGAVHLLHHRGCRKGSSADGS